MEYLDRFKVTGKIAIVTGASKGLGKAMAMGLGEAGATVIAASRTTALIEETAQDIIARGGEAIALPLDVKDPQSIETLVANVTEIFGRVDILVNNAGIAHPKMSMDVTAEDWDDIMDTNLKSVFLLSRTAGKVMAAQKRGKIINIGSILGMTASNLAMPYSVSKAGLAHMTRSLALEWAPLGINVNCLAPGYVQTEMTKEQQENDDYAKFLKYKIPFRRLGRPDELVGAALFLASPASDYMTGAVVVVDGGYTIW